MSWLQSPRITLFTIGSGLGNIFPTQCGPALCSPRFSRKGSGARKCFAAMTNEGWGRI